MTDRRFELDQIYDLPALPPDASHEELLEHQQREDQWRRTREPVAEGSPYVKFVTWQDLIDRNIVTESDVVGNDDPDLDGDPDTNNPDSPDFVNEPRLAVYARDMFLPVTYACSSLTVIENADTKPNLQVLLFDPDTYESAQFVLILPKEWPGRALRYRVYWSHGSGASAHDVSWDMTVHSYQDGESLLTDWATGLRITDTGGDANTMYITDESEPVTVNGDLAKPGDLLIFRITRLAPDATDTLDVDARLHAVEFNIGEVSDLFPPVLGGDPTVLLLLHFDGSDGSSTIVDSGPDGIPLTVTDLAGTGTRIDTAAFLFGQSLLSPSNVANYGYVKTTTTFPDLSDSEFELEVSFNTDPVQEVFWNLVNFIGAGVTLTLSVLEDMDFNLIHHLTFDTNDFTLTAEVTAATWHQVSVSRHAAGWTMCVDGVIVDSTGATPTLLIGSATELRVGECGGTVSGVETCHIDEVRISLGVWHGGTSYTPDVSAFPDP